MKYPKITISQNWLNHPFLGELCWSSYQIKFWDDADFPGADFAYLWAETQENCMDWCLADLECQGLYKKSNEFLLK